MKLALKVIMSLSLWFGWSGLLAPACLQAEEEMVETPWEQHKEVEEPIFLESEIESFYYTETLEPSLVEPHTAVEPHSAPTEKAKEEMVETPWAQHEEVEEPIFLESEIESFYHTDPIESTIVEPNSAPIEKEDQIKLDENFEDAPESQNVNDNLYRLKFGDQLQISVYTEGTSKRLVTVDYSGKITYLKAQEIQAEGKTIVELREDLQKALSIYYRDPLLIISPVEFGSEYYTILGEVHIPGIKPYIGNPTVLTALCQGGGFTTRVFRNQTIDQVDLDHSFLSRNGQYIPVDFNALLSVGDMSQDKSLLPGDYLYLAPKTIPRVYVLGEVNNPTAVSFFDSVSLSEAIAEARGTTRFASSRVAIIRGSLFCPEKFLVDFNRIVKGRALDFQLVSGDIVYVPSMQYSTLKEIVRAGVTAFVSNLFNYAGLNAFIAVQPHAAVTGVIAPATFINPNAGIIAPSVGSVGP